MAKVEEAVGDYADDAKVAEAIKNIKTAMEACDTGDEVTAKFMSSGALNVDEPLVKALNDAIAQAEANDANQMAQERLGTRRRLLSLQQQVVLPLMITSRPLSPSIMV